LKISQAARNAHLGGLRKVCDMEIGESAVRTGHRKLQEGVLPEAQARRGKVVWKGTLRGLRGKECYGAPTSGVMTWRKGLREKHGREARGKLGVVRRAIVCLIFWGSQLALQWTKKKKELPRGAGARD